MLLPKQRRTPQMSMPEPQVCEAPQQPAFQAFNDAEMCEMVKRFVPAQMFSTAVGLQQYGAGDIHKQTDAIAEQGIREVGGALTVLGSSLAHGVGNDGKAGYKMAESTVGTAGESSTGDLKMPDQRALKRLWHGPTADASPMHPTRLT
jgi:hypothetical protein